MRKARLIALLLCLMMLLTVFAGCGSSNSNSNAKQGGVYKHGVEQDIVSLDPAYSFNLGTSCATSNMVESLLSYDPNGKLIPALAQSYSISSDSLEYTFKLRQDVKFWDGTLMTADDVVFSFNHIMDPKVASYTSWMLEGVKKCEKIDDYTVKYTLSSPDSSWIDVMAISAGAVFSKKFYEGLSDPTKFGTSSVGVMGTGPYMFKSWTEGQQVTMTKNPNYWDKDHQPTFDEADIVVMPDAVTRINAIGVNQIQSAFCNPCTQIDLMNSYKSAGVVVEFRNAYTSQTLYFNTTRGAFTDANCRKAVASCFDSQSYVDGILKGAGGVSSASMTLPSMQRGDKAVWDSFYKTAPSYPFDMTKAAEYLAKSSHPKGFSFEVILNQAYPEDQSAMEILQETLKTININMKITVMTPNENHTTRKSASRPYDACVVQWDADYADPLSVLVPTYDSNGTGAGGSNYALYKNTKVDDYLNAAKASKDDKSYAEDVTKALTLIANDCPTKVLSYPKRITLMRDNVAGYKATEFYWMMPFLKYMSYTK